MRVIAGLQAADRRADLSLRGTPSIIKEALEHYQARSNDKYKIYHKRMEGFLKKSAIDHILMGEASEVVSRRSNAEKLLMSARNKSKSEVSRLMSQAEKKVDFNRQMISRTVEQQHKRLEDRIHRRRTMSNRSSCSRDEEENEERNIAFEFKVEGTAKGRRIFI